MIPAPDQMLSFNGSKLGTVLLRCQYGSQPPAKPPKVGIDVGLMERFGLTHTR